MNLSLRNLFNLFIPNDQFNIDCKLPFDIVISRLKNSIQLDENLYSAVFHPNSNKRFFGIFSPPNKFLIKSANNPMRGGYNSGTITEIDVNFDSQKDMTQLHFKVNNLASKMIYVVLITALVGFSIIGFLAFSSDYYILLLILIFLAFLVLIIGNIMINAINDNVKNYFYKILRIR